MTIEEIANNFTYDDGIYLVIYQGKSRIGGAFTYQNWLLEPFKKKVAKSFNLLRDDSFIIKIELE